MNIDSSLVPSNFSLNEKSSKHEKKINNPITEKTGTIAEEIFLSKESNKEVQTIKFESKITIQLPRSEEVVDKIIEKEKKRYLENSLTRPVDWESKRKLYLFTEKYFRKGEIVVPAWGVAGPLNYGMTYTEMKSAIISKFKKMYVNGSLITEASLNNDYKRDRFYPKQGRGGNDLIRIWGAEFLNENLSIESMFKAPKTFLIIEDSVAEIEVEIWHGDYPFLSICRGCYTLAENIEGTPCATDVRGSRELMRVKYMDFKDNGNIMLDSKKNYWIVDTEKKSFDVPELNEEQSFDQAYLKRRFEILAGDEYNNINQIFKIPIKDFLN